MSSNSKNTQPNSAATVQTAVNAASPKPGKKSVISMEKAKAIAMEWQSDFWSGLYAFGSSGILYPGYLEATLEEIEENLSTGVCQKRKLKDCDNSGDSSPNFPRPSCRTIHLNQRMSKRKRCGWSN